VSTFFLDFSENCSGTAVGIFVMVQFKAGRRLPVLHFAGDSLLRRSSCEGWTPALWPRRAALTLQSGNNFVTNSSRNRRNLQLCRDDRRRDCARLRAPFLKIAIGLKAVLGRIARELQRLSRI
jgi:hypothetical protein